MKYIVKKTDKENEFELTHIEQVTLLDGTIAQAIKGVNIIAVEKLEEAITQLQREEQQIFDMLDKNELKKVLIDYKDKVKGNLELTRVNLKSLEEMQEAINLVISE